jgi:RNA polymerase sigma-70 factor (ECF subfamily)
MHTTSVSLLERLRQSTHQEDWKRFVDLYTPLIFSWARGAGLKDPDAADLVQDVLTLVVQKLPEFRYNRDQSFRSWLLTLTLNKWRDGQRRRGVRPREVNNVPLSDLAAPDNVAAFEEAEYRQQLVIRALQVMKTEFRPTTWKACWEHVVSDRSAAEVGRELGLSEGAVYAAKSRVLSRLRQELEGLLD